MPYSDCLLVVTMAICHVCCYYTEGSEKPVVNILIEKLLLDVNVTTMQMNACVCKKELLYRKNATSAVKAVIK